MDLCELPEDLIANVLSLTSPRDACMLCLVSSRFSYAAQLDALWERFLPPDYLDIIGRSSNGSDFINSFASKKDLYSYLCNKFLLIDNGTKSFSLEKISGKKCYMLAARDLHIVSHRRNLKWKSLPSREVAEADSFRFLDVSGKIKTEMLSPNTTYSANFVFTSNPNPYDCLARLSHPHLPLDFNGGDRRSQWPSWCKIGRNSRKRADGWMEFEIGGFFVEGGRNDEVDIKMKLSCAVYGEDMIVDGIDIRPTENRLFIN